MCEIFPEVDKCCFCISHRLAMLFISVMSVMTGVVIVCCIERQSNTNFKNMRNITDLQHIKSPKAALGKISTIVPTGIAIMGGLFMINGLILLFATLTDQEGLVQAFVWSTFVSIVLGFIMIIGVTVECVIDDKTCILRGLDWLSAATTLVAVVFYLCYWIYLISVCNTYVISVFR